MKAVLGDLELEQQATMFSYKKQLRSGNGAGEMSAISSSRFCFHFDK